ncbi:chaperone protein cofactor GrpE [Corynebacterium kutscheri]|uniref:Protein GrpE n=1 Tax=Corynebacterium kutscheri TaxID=35755 RepID=A0A0F6R1S8_9CORY|nr:molecular chaperone GrpE (heat shock protein) [Corynebacterium kutscheri]VEH10386.1 chaperone protein cofactor GrpE [Corynebacterium kutscheri]VEH82013.1 chaperone protein cofactor GrpE [Corynebacterium kutscheri]
MSTDDFAHDPEDISPQADQTDGEDLAAELDPELVAEMKEALGELGETELIEEVTDTEETESSVEVQLAERTEDLQRLSAEYANYRRRTERERLNAIETAKAQVLSQLLPILDDLDLADQHGDLEEGPLKAFRDKFVSTLETQGVHSFGEVGDSFDPERYEAVQDLSEGEEKLVGTVLRKGYVFGERLIRNAMVIISDPS